MPAQARHIALEGDTASPPLPVLTFEGTAAGPCVVITANIHGDEVTGLVAAQRLATRLESELRAGRVILYPTLNPSGLAASTRTVPLDGSDLNRCFPGRRRGRIGERLASLIWRALLEHEPDAVIDLHADSAASIPYALLDRPVSLAAGLRGDMSRRLHELGTATGLTVVHEYPKALYLRYALDRSLAGALVNKARIPAVTIEAGPRRRAREDDVQATAEAVWRVLAHLGLVRADPTPHPTRIGGGPWRRQAGPRTQVPGWLDPRVAPGESFAHRQVLAVLRAADGTVVEELCAPAAGALLSWVDGAWFTAGTVTATLAVAEES